MSRAAVAACFALLALAQPVRAQEDVRIGPQPAWVVTPPPSKAAVPPQQTDEGIPLRVDRADYQVRFGPGRQELFTSLAITFLTPQGLAAGNVSLPWDPETQDLTVHRVRILRDGKPIDLLEEGQTFTVLRREQGLEYAMLDGVLTANMIPAGLEVGDTLDIAYTLETSNPLFKGHGEAPIGPLNALMGQVHVLFAWPSGTRMNLSQPRDLPAWQRSKREGMEIAQFTLDNVEPIVPPRLAPVRYALIRMPEASDFSTWSEVAALFAPLYAEASRIPADGRLREELERVRAQSEDPLRRAELALDLVQDKVRYVALVMGEGGHKPANAADTWSRRFGDCKAKTALLLGLLRELGIEADAVFVSTGIGDALPGRLPMVGAFDHVLVRATIGGREYWLDGTRSGDGKLADLVTPAFHWGLPVRASGAELVRMMPGALDRPDEDLAIDIDASGGLMLPAPARLDLRLRGDSAAAVAATLGTLSGNVRKTALERYWRGRFDFITPDTVDLKTDEATGEMRLTLTGKATLKFNEGWHEIKSMGVGYDADFSRAPGPDSAAPFAVAHPFFNRTVTTIALPNGFEAPVIDGDPIDETVAAIEYHRSAQVTGNVFTATMTSRSLAAEFPASEAPAAEKRLAALDDERLYFKVPGNYRPNAAELASWLEQDLVKPYDLVERGRALLDKGRSDEALADFDRAAKLDPDYVWAWGNRGLVLFRKGDYAGAEQAYRRAAEIDPNYAFALRGLGFVAFQARDFPKAIAAFNRALEADSKDPDTHYQLALSLWGNADAGQALAEVDKAIAVQPAYQPAYHLRPALLMNLQRKDEAAAAVEKLVATFPNSPGVLAAASQLYEDMGLYDKSDQVLGSSLGEQETPMGLLLRAKRRPVSEADQKLVDLNKALAIEPNFPAALVERSNALWADYQLKRALDDANKAIELDPEYLEAYATKAKILVDLNRRNEALAIARKLLENKEEDLVANMMAANIYSRLGMARETQAALDKIEALQRR